MDDSGVHGKQGRPLAVLPADARLDVAPEVGDIWQTSWDESDLVPILVSAVRPTYVMAWPVTGDFEVAIDPAFLLDGSRVGLPQCSAAWPSAECGTGLFLLDRLLGRVEQPRFVTEMRAALHGVGEVPDGVFALDADDPARLAALRDVVESAQRLADIEWPAAIPGEGVLASEAIGEFSLTPRSLAQILPGAPPGQVAAIAAQEQAPTPEQVAALASRLEAEPLDLLEARYGPEIDVLDQPVWKPRIRALSAARHVPERAARNLVVAGAARAARQAGSREDPGAVVARVEAALRRLEAGLE